jgi:hypothetical protein
VRRLLNACGFSILLSGYSFNFPAWRFSFYGRDFSLFSQNLFGKVKFWYRTILPRGLTIVGRYYIVETKYVRPAMRDVIVNSLFTVTFSHRCNLLYRTLV